MRNPIMTLITLALTACGGGKVPVQMLLTDAPADLSLAKSVNVTIDEVKVHVAVTADTEASTPAPEDSDATETGEGKSGWKTVCKESKTFDLLTLTGGKTTPMCGEAEIDQGKITQIRLPVSKAVIVWQDGSETVLDIPSADKTGVKIVGLAKELKDDANEIKLDFDAAASIQVTGTSFSMKPTIKVVD